MSKTIHVDDEGMMFKYVASYAHGGKVWGFTLWAKSFADAEARMKAIARTGEINGRLIEEIDA